MGILKTLTVTTAEASDMGVKLDAKIAQPPGATKKNKKPTQIDFDSELETEHEKPQLSTNNNNNNTYNVPTTTQIATRQQSWGDPMEQLSSVNLEKYDTNYYDHLHPRTLEFVHDIYKRIDATNKVVVQLAATVAENIKLAKENMKLTIELQTANINSSVSLSRVQTSLQSESLQNMHHHQQQQLHSKIHQQKATQLQQPRVNHPDLSQKKRAIATAARHLTETPANQGYQFLYIPTKHRMTISNMRNILRTLRIENSVIANRLLKFGVNIKDDFNPLDLDLLRDTKLVDLSEEERKTKIQEVHHGHIMKALKFIREPVKFSVARSLFLDNQITQAEYDQICSSSRLLPRAGSESAAFAALQQSGNALLSNDDNTIMNDNTNPAGENRPHTRSPTPSPSPPTSI
ncbi:hypothetical protein INT45_000917 [Circinella minor]|uniref:Uncharacterized protein n=1 Tax=Circinella minor TaxID=1195481 RepID=A0A8H7VEX1_9FUNG|nr:hypothetical protein INT45_000917 [Circinella minor]